MSQVTVTIAGHTYRMACNDGEEAHLQGLAKTVNETIERLKGAFGEIGDQRITVMAAITVADDLAEARKTIAKLEVRATLGPIRSPIRSSRRHRESNAWRRI
jgi:cell division protein ZapA